jgi:hypothetical protein
MFVIVPFLFQSHQMMTVLQDIPVKLLSASQLAQFQEPHLPDPEVHSLDR